MPSPQAHNSRSKPTKTKSAKTLSIPISWTQLSKLIFFIFIPRRYYRCWPVKKYCYLNSSKRAWSINASSSSLLNPGPPAPCP